MASTADPTPTPSTQGNSNPPPSQSPIPNSHHSPNPNITNTDSQPYSTQPPSPKPRPQSVPPSLNPNHTTAPPFPPAQINPYTAPPSFRPAGAPPPMHVPQFTPIPHNSSTHGYPTPLPNYGAPPPGVSSAPPPPPQQQQQPMTPGKQGISPQQQQQQPMVPGLQGIPPQQHPPPMMPVQPVMRPYMAMPNGYMHPSSMPHGSLPPPGVVRYPYPPIARPPFLRPGVGMVPPLQRPPVLGLRPAVILPLVRPPVVPIVVPAEKPQTTVYVGKIAPSVENDFIHSLLELCGPIKSWKRAQDPSDGTPRRFGFCEFESAEGVLRALRLLTKCNVDGEELVLNVNQATREYLECYVEKKKDNLTKSSETGIEEAKKEGGNVSDVEKGESNEKEEPAKVAVEEAKKDADETENKENDTASFGLVTDEDRDVDRETLEKLTSMIEERIKTKPLPPPPPPQKIIDGMTNLNCEVPSKSWDKDSDVETLKNEDRMDNETTSETKPSHRAGTESPDRSRRYDNRSRDRDRDRRDKERELDRLERERERERARRERERDLEIQKAERFYKEQVKEWEIREKEREYERKREREKEKERERERRRLIADQEDESDDDSRKRRRKSEIEDKRRRRRREKEDDLADRLKEEEEIVEAKKRAEEERQRQLEKEALRPPVQVDNGSDKPISLFPEVAASEIKDGMEVDHDSVPVPAPSPSASAPAPVSYNGDGNVENGYTEEPAMVPDSLPDVKLMGNAPAKKLGFGLLGSGKRTAVPSVFHEEEDDDAQKDKKMRPLVPIDYSTEELQAVHTNVGEAPQISAASADSNKRNNSREAKSDVEKDRSRRYNDRSSHWDRQRDGDEAPRVQDILDAKQLIDMIPKTKADLFSYEINWAVYDENRLHERMRPWISKKIAEFLGEEETTLVEFIVDRFREHVQAEKMLDVLQRILDEEAEMFVLKMWRMLIFEIKKVETGLTTRPES